MRTTIAQCLNNNGDIPSLLRTRQIQILYDQLPIALIANAVAAAFLVFIFWTVTPHSVLLGWFASLMLVISARVILIHQYNHTAVEQKVTNVWLLLFISGVLFTAFLWSVSGIILVPDDNAVLRGIAILWLCGLSAGAISTLSVIKGVFILFITVTLSPLVVYLLLQGERIEIMMACATIMFYGFILLNALRMNKTLIYNLHLQTDNSELLVKLSTGKKRVEQFNVELEKQIEARTEELTKLVNEIAKRKHVEQTLRESEEELHLLLDSTAVAIYGVDLNGNCTFANTACINILGYQDQDRLLGQNMHQLIHHTKSNGESYRDKDCQIYKAYRSGERVREDNEIFWRIDGSSFAVRYWSNPVYKNNKLVGCVVNFIDLTEQLEKESQLNQAQKMEVMGQLTGGIAHDFNNLLTIIIGNLKFLEEEIGCEIKEEDRMLIDAALTAAWDAADLTHGLLAVSRKQLLQPKNIDVNTITEDFVYLIRRTLGGNIEIQLNKLRKPVHVYADPVQLKNALFNLAINARDAMPNGGNIKIDIQCKKIQDDSDPDELKKGSYIIISVTDNGKGMSQEEIIKACDPFFTTKEAGRGTGLGLSTVYGFSKQSNGKMVIESTPGKGTTVSIFLPVTGADTEISLNDGFEKELSKGTETILVTEDDKEVRKLAVKSLERLGYTVLEAENAEAAIGMIKMDNNIDLLFSDIIMPGNMSGHDLSNWTLKNYPNIKILLTTGFNNISCEGANELAPSVPVLNKPYSKSELALKVRSILDN